MRNCGIGLASIVVILLIRHRFAKKMSMKEHDLAIRIVWYLYRWHYESSVLYGYVLNKTSTLLAAKRESSVLH